MELVLWLEEQGIQFWLISFLTLAVFSFLYRDNPVYKFAEHLYVGLAAGYSFYLAFKDTIYPNLVQHLIEGVNEIQAGKGAWATQARWGALLMGMLVLSRLIPKIAWVSRWPMALVVGAFAGLNITGFAKTNLVDQMHATLLPLAGLTADGQAIPFWPLLDRVTAASVFNHAILVSGVILALIYFFFSPKQGRVMTELGKLGISVIMITFGATYGSIVLARISLLIGRLQSLSESNLREHHYPALSSAIVIVLLLVIWRVFIFKPEADEAA